MRSVGYQESFTYIPRYPSVRFEEIEPYVNEGIDLELQYRDGSGDVTERTIIPDRLYRSSNGLCYLKGYCRLREEDRTFRLDRILSFEPLEDLQAKECPNPEFPESTNPQSSINTIIRYQQKPDLSVPPSTSPEFRKAVPRDKRFSFGKVLMTIIAFVIAAALYQEYWAYDIPDYTKAPVYQLNTRAAPQPAPAPAPPTSYFYRNVMIRKVTSSDSTRWEAPLYDLSAQTPKQLHYVINSRKFRQITGIADRALESLYASADYDSNGHLSWREINRFQNSLYRKYRYINNTYALRPDQFLGQGGGDCEDWALMTCGLLRYWGWNCRVASYGPSDGGTGHAIAMVWSEKPVKGCGYVYLREGTYIGRSAVKPGYYIPIDYNYVGGISEAVGRDWYLRNFYKPEEIYGKIM
jgi:hypothetical protein